MTWRVTYRTKDGKQASTVFEAANRDELFKQLSDKGISAIRVEQGRSSTKKKQIQLPVRWIAAGTILVAGIAIALWFAANRKSQPSTPTAEPTAKRAIKTLPPPVATTNTPAVAPAAPEKPVRRSAKGTPIPDNVQPDERGVLRYPGGLRWVDTNDLHMVKHPRKKQLFKHHSENSIATILTLEPEKMAPFLVGRRPKFGQRFVDDFKASLYDEPEFPDDDTPEERELRNEVLAVKKEMAEALNRGEDIAKMMNDAQEELDRLVTFHDTLMKQLREIKADEKYTDNDVRDFTEAANQMLKGQGLKELATPNLTYRQFMLQRRRERMEAQQTESERK